MGGYATELGGFLLPTWPRHVSRGGFVSGMSCLFGNMTLMKSHQWEVYLVFTVLLGGGSGQGSARRQGTVATTGVSEARLKQTCGHLLFRARGSTFWSCFFSLP